MDVLNKIKSKVFTNSLWMMSEKIISIFGLIFVTSFVAKYIGPENFGKMTFATTIFALLQTAAMWGTENLIFQKVSQNRKTGERFIDSTKIVRTILYFVLGTVFLLYLYLFFDRITFIFSVAACIGVYFALQDVYLIYFNAILESKINAFCNVLGLTISLLIRYVIAEFELPIEYLSIPIVVLTLIPYVIRRIIYNNKKTTKDENIKHKYKYYRKYMIGVGSKLVLYSLSVAIFTKTAQFFLGIKSQYELGIYTVAATLGTSFYFVLVAFISSFMTQIYKEKNMEKSKNMVAQLNTLVIAIAIAVTFFFMLFGDFIIQILYGNAYKEANEILILMVFVCLFSGLSTVAEKYLIGLNAYTYLQRKTNILVVFNILITYVAVYFWGLKGAVFSILVTEIFSATILNYFYKNRLILDTHFRIFKLSTYLKKN